MRKLLCWLGFHKKQSFGRRDEEAWTMHFLQVCTCCGKIREAQTFGHPMAGEAIMKETKWHVPTDEEEERLGLNR